MLERTASPQPAVIRVSPKFQPMISFRSPSGNVGCFFTAGVICTARVHSWTSHAPEPQTECPPAKRTSGIQLGDRLEERSDCYDAVEEADTAVVVLPYGHGLELQGFRCISEQRGITCVRVADGVGFSISRDVLRHDPWDSPLLHVTAGTLDRSRTTVFPAGFQLTFRGGDFGDCILQARLASCLVNTDAPSPPEDPSCELDDSLTASVSGDRRGELVRECRGDANGGMDLVGPGRSLQVGDLQCDVTTTRLRCAHLGGSRHGFEVNAKTFRGF